MTNSNFTKTLKRSGITYSFINTKDARGIAVAVNVPKVVSTYAPFVRKYGKRVVKNLAKVLA